MVGYPGMSRWSFESANQVPGDAYQVLTTDRGQKNEENSVFMVCRV